VRLRAVAAHGLATSPVSEILIEQSIAGWKEYELEVMRDHADNVVVICSIENFDAMGVHTGDSITVAPAQTLTDVEYQRLRDEAFACIRRIGVDTGGSNIQFAVNPANGDVVVIEMNPRVSRSSALASKATGFPIAKIAARLAVGYRLDEILNDITGETPASFEPTIDYVVTKVPRWAFEKLPGASPVLGTMMQSVGEVMAIGRTFPESLQKALRSLETGRWGLNCDPTEREYDAHTPDQLVRLCVQATPERPFLLEAALRRGQPLLCTNPDTSLTVGATRLRFAGLVAERYRALGGHVVETGKPGALIYRRALDKAESVRGRPVAPAQVLGIGDTVALDVAGALGNGFAALQIGAAQPPPMVASDRLYRMPALVW